MFLSLVLLKSTFSSFCLERQSFLSSIPEVHSVQNSGFIITTVKLQDFMEN